MTILRLKRGLFGYSRKSVREVVADRDVTIIQVSKGARESEEKIAGLEAELEGARRGVIESDARNRELASQLKDPRSDPARGPGPGGRREGTRWGALGAEPGSLGHPSLRAVHRRVAIRVFADRA